MSGYCCVFGGKFFDCIMYADDLVLISHSVCVLQKTIDICIDALNCIGLSFYVKKSCLLRFGPRYMRACEPISLHMYIRHKARYLGVTLCSGRCFGMDLRSAKSNFYSSFNGIFHSYQNKLVVLHLVGPICLM